MRTYTTEGDVRGTCGHKHKSARTAGECAQRDADGCRSQGGYSDRYMVVHEDDEQVGATDDERDEYSGYEDDGRLSY